MKSSNKNVDVARNFTALEWLRSEMLSQISLLFKAMLKTGEDAVLEALAGIIISAYLLGKRMGIGFEHVDSKIEAKVKANIDSDHEIEKWYHDFTSLYYHLTDKK